ncbi:response regulator [Bacteroides xylanisolvens]|uniref:hybrid sensor histidine kinase/response regulator transcription factor n=1 Tax=Bacteroides xylanisolvens TaxID=371601 RepID=UPI00125F2EFE|nr:hybrid sensor histidine kinase/response regulator transcription factor [Bacteroides xylanisolvens]KAB6257833.1 response regulator [Bacteroides xylanisolvens]
MIYPANASIEIHARNLTATDGLANNSIRHIYQDSKGFIWFSTLNGLSRYDGNSFVTFRPQSGEELSLADHRIRSVQEDSDGFLWITTSAEQISCYDLKKDCFVDFTGKGEMKDRYNEVTILPNKDIWLWGRVQGCRKITYKNNKFSSETYSTDNHKLKSDNIRFLSVFDSNSIWIGTGKGLYLLKDNTLECIDSTHYFLQSAVIDNTIYFITSEGFIWKYNQQHLTKVANTATSTDFLLTGNIVLRNEWLLFTKQGGILFNPKTNTTRIAPEELNIRNGLVVKDNRNNYWVHNQTGYINYIQKESGSVKKIDVRSSKLPYFIDYERYHVYHDSRDIIWITTYGNGLFAYNPTTKELEHFTATANHTNPIASNYLQYIIEDHSGNLWTSSEYSGISQIEIINKGAAKVYPEGELNIDRANAIRFISHMQDDEVWITTRAGGLYIYDNKLTKQKSKKYYDINIYSACEDSKGNIWLGTRGKGLQVGDDQHYIHQATDTNSLAADPVFCILQDRKQRMWIGTFGGGLDLAVPKKDKYIFRHFFNKTYGQKEIRTICEDRNGWIWVGTSEGVFVFDPDRIIKDPNDFYQYNLDNHALKSNEIKSIIQDKKGRIWIAESGIGFCVANIKNDYKDISFTHYTVNDGLVHSVVQAFIEDDEGNIWVSTEYGISCFNPENKIFNNYFFSNDILGNVYTEGCAKLKDGRLAFGTNHGLIILNTKQIKNKEKILSVTFTDLKLNGISVRPADMDSPLTAALAYTDAISLKYYQSSFVIDFSTFDYPISTNTRFSYKLEGYDDDWSIPSTLNFAAYKNLPAGTYYLHVKACSVSGIWSDNEETLEIKVTPPFWATGWAFFVYILIAGIIMYFVYRTIRNINNLRNKIKVEKQLTEYKLVFFTNISHEFRTPLTLIQGALDRIHRTHNIPKEIRYSIKLMDKSTQRMLRLINQLLEFRKMQNNKLALSLEETDVIAFLYEIYLSFQDTAESKNMDFKFIPSVNSYKMYIDKGNIDKIAYNLLSNAFKYTPSGGKIEFSIYIDKQKQLLIMKVTDTGVGIPKEKRNELFKRFMQSSFSSDSIGVGLHLTHELVHVHKGNICYEENPSGGSIFIVTLPTDSSIYQSNDFLIPENAILKEEAQNHPSLSALNEENAHSESEEEIDKEVENIEKELKTELNASDQEGPLNKRKILIIEDDNDVREFLKEELTPYFEVAAEADGKNGLEYAHNNDIDLIISDVMMPGYNGFEITRKLKSDFSTSHIPIILLTALNAAESHLEGVKSGADSYITKPFSTKLLLASIFKLIEQRDKLKEKFSNDLSAKRPVMCTSDKDKEFVENLTKIVEEQLTNPEFTADDFASMMSLGRTIFYRKVRGVTGYTPKEYLRIMRMKKAAELLSTKKYTVSEVTYMVGINDPFYFSRCFKAQFGISPSSYQKRYQEGIRETEINED